MKKIFPYLFCFLLFSHAITARQSDYTLNYVDEVKVEVPAKNNLYLQLLSGANWISVEQHLGSNAFFNTGAVVSVCLGYHWHFGIRFEGEFAFRKNFINKSLSQSLNFDGHLTSYCYMANLLWELPIEWVVYEWRKIQPYVGLGIGYDTQHTYIGSISGRYARDAKDFAWQIIGGLNYQLFSCADLLLDYKFHKAGLNHINNHSLQLGLCYKFNASIR